MQLFDPTRDLRKRRSVERAMFLLNNFVMLPRTRDRPESRLKSKQERKISMFSKRPRQVGVVSSIHRVLKYSLVSYGHVESKLLTDYYWV